MIKTFRDITIARSHVMYPHTVEQELQKRPYRPQAIHSRLRHLGPVHSQPLEHEVPTEDYE